MLSRAVHPAFFSDLDSENFIACGVLVLTTTSHSVSGLVHAVAKELRQQNLVSTPAWVSFVKSGSHAERVPQSKEFWFERCASVLVTVDRRPVGVRRLRNKYGGRTGNTVSRSHHRKAGGKMVRVAMQQLEKSGLVAKKAKAGRVITPAGRKLVAKAAKSA